MHGENKECFFDRLFTKKYSEIMHLERNRHVLQNHAWGSLCLHLLETSESCRMLSRQETEQVLLAKACLLKAKQMLHHLL